MRIPKQKIINLADELGIEIFRTYFAWTFYYDDEEHEFIGPNKNKKAYDFLTNISKERYQKKEDLRMEAKYVTYYDAGLNKVQIPCGICNRIINKYIVVKDEIGRPFKYVCSEECEMKARELLIAETKKQDNEPDLIEDDRAYNQDLIQRANDEDML